MRLHILICSSIAFAKYIQYNAIAYILIYLLLHCISSFRSFFPTCLYSDTKKQIVLDGPRSCGKSIALAMLVHWARTEGWLVLYVPHGKDWTHGGFFYRNTYSDFFDTPVQAAKILQVLSSVVLYVLVASNRLSFIFLLSFLSICECR